MKPDIFDIETLIEKTMTEAKLKEWTGQKFRLTLTERLDKALDAYVSKLKKERDTAEGHVKSLKREIKTYQQQLNLGV